MKRNSIIDGYKLFIIIWIALFHYTYMYNKIGEYGIITYQCVFKYGGFVGVSMFFVLSGFFMTKTLIDGPGGARNYLVYCTKRYFRLWLPYFISCIIIYIFLTTYPLPQGEISVTTLLINILSFVHPKVGYVDGAHWFLNTLFVLQVFLGLLILLKNSKVRTRFLLLINFIMVALMWSCRLFNEPITYTYTTSLFQILIGCNLYMVIKKRNMSFMLPFLGALVYSKLLLYYLAIAVLICLLTIPYPVRFENKRINSILKFLGGLSFCWYLVHQKIGYSMIYHYALGRDICELWLITPLTVTLLIAIFVNAMSNVMRTFIVNKLPTIRKYA